MSNKLKWIPKGWGGELIVANNDNYCGKVLKFIKGHKLSLHYHKVKSETFFLNYGKLKILYFDDVELAKKLINAEGVEYFKQYYCQEVILEKGDAFEVPVGRIHQMIALEESELFEFSTTDFPEDSYRLQKGD